MDTVENENANTKPGGKAGWWKPVVLLAAVLAMIVLAQVFGLGEHFKKLDTWLADLGSLGPVVFILIYVGATIAALPGSAMTVIAGTLFGAVMGVVVVSIASTLGASLCFLIARYFARDAAARWLSRSEKFARLDKMTEEHGNIIVALTRLVPLFPFNFLNYGFGLTSVRFWTYVFWSWLCMIPGTILYVVGGAAIKEAIKKGEVPWVLVGVIAVMIVILTLLVRHAKRTLRSKEGADA